MKIAPKPIRICLCVLLLSALLTSCRSQRRVVRGDEIYDPVTVTVPPRQQDTPAPAYTGNDVTSALLAEAYSWMGTPYRYGGNDRKGADCSGFVMVVYNTALDIKLPRVSREQGEFCQRIKKADLFPGDLVFFVTDKSNKVSHVGIYVGDGMMIHASSSKGVILSDLNQPYYVKHLSHYGRVTQYYDMVKSAAAPAKSSKPSKKSRKRGRR